MEPVRPEFVPDPSLARSEMEALQREIAETADFTDDGEAIEGILENGSNSEDAPVIAGVDQAFQGDQAVSAIVLTCGDEVVERAHAVVPTEVPYIPGFLAFREGGSILAAFAALENDPDVALFDGSGRIHYREAGLATHVGVTLDLPSIGVAKRLLCGSPRHSLEPKLPAGTRIAIDADDVVETAEDTLIGYAVQTRQFDHANRYVNPIFVSPGHGVSASAAADLVEACCSEYKLPDQIKLADSYADERATALQ